MDVNVHTSTTHGLHSSNSHPVTPPLNPPGEKRPLELIKVSANSRSTAVAGAIAGVIREHRHAYVQAIGASAVNQAVKAIAIASGYLELDGIVITCLPAFAEVMIDGNERTAVRISVDAQ
ncbi:MAG: stage V sporulation protein S [Chloroflexota bacterium]|nr:stage V sporulation protein S [Chloroflexota bacterium]